MSSQEAARWTVCSLPRSHPVDASEFASDDEILRAAFALFAEVLDLCPGTYYGSKRRHPHLAPGVMRR
ncbi:hypothetical protein ETD83_22600 [Actinomadura soli]|uniref:Uncharacterized protein n=1 Tax=Actinomadura soli TaxID=2508997 RepID=A0A5C4JAM3_9ACTN|nr:hypothetical protein [Actinomadura soli]TMQ95321.1 hypothetical protein ETD83_22600 [Actinomadura soli]